MSTSTRTPTPAGPQQPQRPYRRPKRGVIARLVPEGLRDLVADILGLLPVLALVGVVLAHFGVIDTSAMTSTAGSSATTGTRMTAARSRPRTSEHASTSASAKGAHRGRVVGGTVRVQATVREQSGSQSQSQSAAAPGHAKTIESAITAPSPKVKAATTNRPDQPASSPSASTSTSTSASTASNANDAVSATAQRNPGGPELSVICDNGIIDGEQIRSCREDVQPPTGTADEMVVRYRLSVDSSDAAPSYSAWSSPCPAAGLTFNSTQLRGGGTTFLVQFEGVDQTTGQTTGPATVTMEGTG